MNNATIHNYNSLDFDDIKEKLKNFLKSKEEFKDYNFEGSNLSVLMDLLAYNTHYESAYLNFAINEVFLESATRRENVLSNSGQLGYIPYSARSSEVKVDIILENFKSMPEKLALDSKVIFNTVIGDTAYSFRIKDSNTSYYGTRVMIDGVTNIERCDSIEANEQGNAFLFKDVELIEGVSVINYFDVKSDSEYIFTLINKLADMNTLKVTVYPSADVMHQSLKDIEYVNSNIRRPIYSTYNNGNTFSYFYKESGEESFDVIFKHGSLKKGNVIKLEYIVCSGKEANGAINFVMSNYAHLINQQSEMPEKISVNARYQSNSGHDKEGLESIRENAPKFYAAQDRAVSVGDYEALLINRFGYIDAISVWGGEDEVEPQPGKVLIAIKPVNGRYLQENQKNEIESFLKTRSGSLVISIEDVNYLESNIIANVSYHAGKLGSNYSRIKMSEDITASIRNFCDRNLKKFNDRLQLSSLTTSLMNEFRYIESVDFEMNLTATFDTRVKDINALYEVDLFNAVRQIPGGGAIKSTPFTIYNSGTSSQYNITDDGLGNVILKSDLDMFNKRVGTIDYNTGYITFSQILPVNNSITLSITPLNRNITNTKNNLILVENKNINVNIMDNEDKRRFVKSDVGF